MVFRPVINKFCCNCVIFKFLAYYQNCIWEFAPSLFYLVGNEFSLSAVVVSDFRLNLRCLLSSVTFQVCGAALLGKKGVLGAVAGIQNQTMLSIAFGAVSFEVLRFIFSFHFFLQRQLQIVEFVVACDVFEVM